jgi:metal-responsive CopG/Arc/MetJ family transcriptional regulator
MKTAISIPDPLFHAAEAAAKRLALSRSELYAKAVEEYLQARSETDVTQRLNEVYAKHSSAVEPLLYDAAVSSIGPEEW